MVGRQVQTPRLYYRPLYSNMDRTSHSNAYNQYLNNDTMFDSHFTRASQQQGHEDNWFTEQRAYSKSVLAGWGLPLGELHYSHDNEQTLRTIVELIGLRQKDIQFRSKVKEDIAVITFQKDKYRSFMEQAQRNLEESLKKLGKTQNEASELKLKGKRTEAMSKKERDEDKKMISMLRAKNQQIMHEIKKKEQEVNRIKEQMKKSVGQKSMISARNSFQVFEGMSPLKREPVKQQQAKYAFLLERNERQIGQLIKENGLLRQKIFEIREHLLNFNQWVDKQLFGESDPQKFQRNSRFPLNHNLLYKKESLSDELFQLLEIAKDGIKQLRDLFRGGSISVQKKTRSSQLLPKSDKDQNEYELNFRKKNSKPLLSKTERPKLGQQQKEKREGTGKKIGISKQSDQLISGNITPRSNKMQSPRGEGKSSPNFKNFTKGVEAKQWEKGKKTNAAMQPSQLPFEDELLSDVIQHGDDSSIVSHIEVEKIGKNKFDKWDILYQDDE